MLESAAWNPAVMCVSWECAAQDVVDMAEDLSVLCEIPCEQI